MSPFRLQLPNAFCHTRSIFQTQADLDPFPLTSDLYTPMRYGLAFSSTFSRTSLFHSCGLCVEYFLCRE